VWGLDVLLLTFSIKKEELDGNNLEAPSIPKGGCQQPAMDDSVRRYAILHFRFLLSMTVLGSSQPLPLLRVSPPLHLS
jgi:hypothetical protein